MLKTLESGKHLICHDYEIILVFPSIWNETMLFVSRWLSGGTKECLVINMEIRQGERFFFLIKMVLLIVMEFYIHLFLVQKKMMTIHLTS